MAYGPTTKAAQVLHARKYRDNGETFEEAMIRIASAISDNEEHYKAFLDALLNMRFMPGGRNQAALGATRQTTPYNCFVSGTIEDSMNSIMQRASEAAETMRQGGGIGYDFSRIRPQGDLIVSLKSRASGPISFMDVYNAVCRTIMSTDHRRGAQMGVLRVDHPDIEKYIRAKQNTEEFKFFNLSVGITDEFMDVVKFNKPFMLRFPFTLADGSKGWKVYKEVNARKLWDEIMRSTWDWAEPGVLFLDTINKMNNLWYCETIEATNPCAEQPLPPFGACLLGSFNLTQYVRGWDDFDWELFKKDIHAAVRAMDNVVDVAKYPLPQQQEEAQSKRRMGLGITGLANALEIMGMTYGSPEFIEFTKDVMRCLRNHAYRASIELAKEKGSFKLFDRDKYLEGNFIRTLPESIRNQIYNFGIRNSHLISIAPTGTISMCADNVSSGIEPVFSHQYTRAILTDDGQETVLIKDYAYDKYGVKGKTADELSVNEHLDVLLAVAEFVDSSVSKTLNVGDKVTFDQFKYIYMKAYQGKAKGCTTFRASGKRYGILNKVETEGAACYYDPATGKKSCE